MYNRVKFFTETVYTILNVNNVCMYKMTTLLANLQYNVVHMIYEIQRPLSHVPF